MSTRGPVNDGATKVVMPLLCTMSARRFYIETWVKISLNLSCRFCCFKSKKHYYACTAVSLHSLFYCTNAKGGKGGQLQRVRGKGWGLNLFLSFPTISSTVNTAEDIQNHEAVLRRWA